MDRFEFAVYYCFDGGGEKEAIDCINATADDICTLFYTSVLQHEQYGGREGGGGELLTYLKRKLPEMAIFASKCPEIRSILLGNVQKIVGVGEKRRKLYLEFLRKEEILIECVFTDKGGSSHLVELCVQLCDDWRIKYA
jgi:hypothetical protein